MVSLDLSVYGNSLTSVPRHYRIWCIYKSGKSLVYTTLPCLCSLGRLPQYLTIFCLVNGLMNPGLGHSQPSNTECVFPLLHHTYYCPHIEDYNDISLDTVPEIFTKMPHQSHIVDEVQTTSPMTLQPLRLGCIWCTTIRWWSWSQDFVQNSQRMFVSRNSLMKINKCLWTGEEPMINMDSHAADQENRKSQILELAKCKASK